MTWTTVVLCASFSVIFGLLFGRLYAWWLEDRDEHDAMISASLKARYDQHRWDEFVVDQPDVFIGDLGAGPRFVVRVPYDHEAES